MLLCTQAHSCFKKACMIVGIVLITVFPSIVTSVPDWLMGASR